ncbi:MAG: HAMP domain-containing sensor histidine kinase [Elusimicrobiota bacterium]
MPEEEPTTKFMPAEKASVGEVERQRKMFAEAPVVCDALDGMLNFSLILNSQRQTVYVNKSFAGFLAQHGINDFVGQRTGDLSGCMHAMETSGGCGTTEYCLRCGAGQAIAQALSGTASIKECRIMSRKTGEDLDLRVRVQTLKYNGEEFLLMSLMDISTEKRHDILERLFFHDILNTAGGLQGLVSLMMDCEPVESKSYVPAAIKASDRMIDQILSQKELTAAERGDLQPKISEVSSMDLLNELADLFKAHDVAKNKGIVVSGDCQNLKISTDKNLLSRVISNLIKNALEAEPSGAKITLSCHKIPEGAAFTVHNPSRMPEDSRFQIFQRSFSTKGTGRGLGTYSIRLLTEKYLKGKVFFVSDANGTLFTAVYPEKI